MRKRIEYIQTFLIIISLWLLMACANADHKAEMNAAANKEIEDWVEDELTQSFLSVDSISTSSKEAFVERAIQKLNDFYGYLAVASDSSYDSFFRQKAAEQAILLSTDKHNQILVLDKKYSIDEFSQRASSSKTKIIGQPQQVQLADSIVYFKNKKYYKGSLSYVIFNKEVNTDFYIQKVEKSFGAEKKEVWEVLLGDTK